MSRFCLYALLFGIAVMAWPDAIKAQDGRGTVADPMHDETVDSLGTILRTQLENEGTGEGIPDPEIIEGEGERAPATGTKPEDVESDVRVDPDFLAGDGKAFDDYNAVTVRILDKITAETRSFDLEVGKTVAFGSIRIRPMTCKKAPPIEEPESASFLQIWEKMPEGGDEWVFSGWMFASSPSLSAMDHPVYDVWVLDCKDQTDTEEPAQDQPPVK